MALEEATPTAAELKALAWEDLLGGARSPVCYDYAIALLYPPPPENSTAWKVHTLVAYVASLTLDLDPKSEAEPFKVSSRLGNLGIASLTPAQLSALTEWLPEIPAPALKARVADILWLHRKDKRVHDLGQIAIEAYLQCAQQYADSGTELRETVVAMTRAMAIARKMGISRDEASAFVATHIERILAMRQTLTVGLRDVGLMKLLLKYGIGDAQFYAQFAQQAAELLEGKAASETYATNLSLMIAREYWTIAAQWYRLTVAKNAPPPPEWSYARSQASETFVKEADKARDAGQLLVEAGFLSDAIAHLKRSGEKRERVDELIRRMMKCRKNAPWIPLSVPLDVSDLMLAAQQQVSDKSMAEALNALAHITAIPTREQLRDMAEGYLEKSITSRLFPMMLSATDARLVANMPALPSRADGETEDEYEEKRQRVLHWHMWQQAEWLRMVACGHIEGARSQVVVEHNPDISDLFPLVGGSLLVPKGHMYLFAKGLHAGLHGDMITAVHILMPQLEHALRWFIETNFDIVMIRQNDDGTQAVSLMKRIIANKELASVLGEDMMFLLDGLLIRQESSNLRNNLAHGLLSDGGFGPDAVYFWWLCLHLCSRLRPEHFAIEVDEGAPNTIPPIAPSD